MKTDWIRTRCSIALLMCVTGLLDWQVSDASEQVDQLIQAAFSLDADPAHGATAFTRYCMSCHGPTALGDARRAIPALAGQRQAYLIKQLADFSRDDRHSIDMQAVVRTTRVSEPQVWADVAAYLNALPIASVVQKGDGSKVSLGEAVFREQCSSCHQEDARGDDDGFVPSLRNQHYSYLLRQLHAFHNNHRTNAEEELVRFIGSLDNDEITGVADYLSRLTGPGRDRLKMRDNGVVGD